jgi:hypothetical protein
VHQYTTHMRGKALLLAEMERVGVSPSYSAPTLICIREGSPAGPDGSGPRDGLFILMANHEYGVSGLDANQITRATLRARAEVHDMVAKLRALGGVWSDVALVNTGAQIGVREARRIHGRYTVTVDDLVSGARHEDGVCLVKFPVDVHSTNPERGKSVETVNRAIKSQPYDIPLRALIARDVDGLVLAGRCISGDFIAHSSYRVTGDAVTMGQAAGTVAALAALAGVLPHEVPWAQVRDGLARLAAWCETGHMPASAGASAAQAERTPALAGV